MENGQSIDSPGQGPDARFPRAGASLRRIFPAVLVLFIAMSSRLPATPGAGIVTADEYEIRAAFLYNFAKFVQWPDADSGDELGVCIIGVDPFGAVLDSIVGRRVGTLRVAVHRLQWQDRLTPCHVAYVSRSEQPRLQQLLSRLRHLPLLTVSDIPGFVDRGGMIMFHREGKKVRFSINPDSARLAGLKISGQLLRLAREVTREQGDTPP